METTQELASPPPDRSLFKGFLAGAIGGLVGAAAKAAGEAIYPPATQGQIAPPAVLVNPNGGPFPHGDGRVGLSAGNSLGLRGFGRRRIRCADGVSACRHTASRSKLWL